MRKYDGLSGNSGVASYESRRDRIIIKFQDGPVYTYSYRSAGSDHVEKMKDLAEKGRGLTTYINKYVRDLYEL